jgi:cellulose synthase/poly-beta-1,6-N-acetylglucosamine synthase-like glycosyltransferase
MSSLQLALAICFWGCFAFVFYSYGCYPAVIALFARLLGRKNTSPPDLPDERLPVVSLLVAAYNEAAVINERVRNALSMDYPRDKLDIVIACDGCADATADIVRRYEAQGVRVLDYKERRGKATVLNSAVAELQGDIFLFSDANTNFDPDAIRRLVRWFVDPQIGVVCGRLVLTDPHTGRNVDGLYWKYETFLKKCEGRLGALLGVNGAIYAIRRTLYTPIPVGTLVDDFVMPLLAKLHSGCAIIYDAEAIAREESAPDVASEFHRRSRIGAGGFQSIGMLWPLLNPLRGWVSFTYFSHKILRWFCPFFLLGMLVSSLLLWDHPLYLTLFIAQVAFYALSVTAAYLPIRSRLLKPLRLTTMFTSMNAALFFGFWRWLRGGQKGTWRRTARSPETGGIVR